MAQKLQLWIAILIAQRYTCKIVPLRCFLLRFLAKAHTDTLIRQIRAANNSSTDAITITTGKIANDDALNNWCILTNQY